MTRRASGPRTTTRKPSPRPSTKREARSTRADLARSQAFRCRGRRGEPWPGSRHDVRGAARPGRFLHEVDDGLVLVPGALAEADLAGARDGVVAIEDLPGELGVFVALGTVAQFGVHEPAVAGDAATTPV